MKPRILIVASLALLLAALPATAELYTVELTNGTEFDPGWRNPPLDLSPALADLDFDTVIEDPLAWLADNRSLLRQLIDDNAVLLERYNRLAQLTGYAFTLTPDYRAPIPNYSDLSAIHRLNSLALAATVVADGTNLARLREACSELDDGVLEEP